MINFDTIKTYSTEYPTSWSFLYLLDDVDSISQEHKDQIFFLNKEANEFVKNYMDSSKMIAGPVWKPFNDKYFKTIQEFDLTGKTKTNLKNGYMLNPFDSINLFMCMAMEVDR